MAPSLTSKCLQKSSNTGGVKPMSIEGPHTHESDRVTWSDEDRAWRKQWVKDQSLAPDEPRRVPELERELRNPIRRFFAYPNAMFYQFLLPKVGHNAAMVSRIFVPKILGTLIVAYGVFYYLKYNKGTWERQGGFRTIYLPPPVHPGTKEYELGIVEKEPSDYFHDGFKNRKVFLD